MPRNVIFTYHAAADGVVDIMIYVCNDIGYPDNLRFPGQGLFMIVIDQYIAFTL